MWHTGALPLLLRILTVIQTAETNWKEVTLLQLLPPFPLHQSRPYADVLNHILTHRRSEHARARVRAPVGSPTRAHVRTSLYFSCTHIL